MLCKFGYIIVCQLWKTSAKTGYDDTTYFGGRHTQMEVNIREDCGRATSELGCSVMCDSIRFVPLSRNY